MAFVLALDQGTSSSRAFVIDDRGHAAAFAQREIAQHYPQPGWVEHDPHEIWISQYETAHEALSRAGVQARDIAAIGVTNQRETALLWDRATGQPIHNAIVWQDRRTSQSCDALRDRGLAPQIAELTGLPIDPYFSATKLAWLLEHCPGARQRAERGELAFGTVDTWLIWNLTGGARHVTDVTNASRTMLFDIHRLEWSSDLLRIFDIPQSLLPEVLPCTAPFGTSLDGIFGGAVAIAGVAGDQQAALIGQAGFEPGIAKNTYGTGSFLMLNTGTKCVRSRHGLLSTPAYAFDRRSAAYALEGSVFSAGSAVQWLRDGLRIVERASDIEALAGECADNGGVYFVPAFNGLGAPYWDAHARALLAGITRGTTRAHIARAALEAIALQSCDVIEAMERDADLQLKELRADGGAAANDLLMQLQADLLGKPVLRPRMAETTALGAAYLAGLQSGVWADAAALERLWEEQRRFVPQMEMRQRDAIARGWRRAVHRARTAE
jgi:glycerol kinase